MLARKAVLNALYYSGLQAMLNPLLAGKGAVLMLHHVRNEELTEFSPNYHLSVSPSFLDKLLAALAPYYDFVSMDEVHARLVDKTDKRAKPFLAVTLDDGYIDNLESAVPIFRKHNAPYTIYVAPGMAAGKVPIWWEDVEICIRMRDRVVLDLPSGTREFDTSSSDLKNQSFREIMSILFDEVDEHQARDIVTQLSKNAGHDPIAHLKASVADMDAIERANRDPLCTIGAHTMSHFVLSKLDEDTLKQELEHSKQLLEEKLGQEIVHLAYPYGSEQAASLREFKMARNLGFNTAVTTRHGVVYSECAQHIHALPRVSVNGHFQDTRYMNTLLSGVPTRLQNKGRKLNVA
ncbi:MAG: polysaccharide deacetylase family protein [Rhizobiaceae bacterium]|nr:polysaccharide deacetylase family protein [Rhizobiaceae bacterium]